MHKNLSCLGFSLAMGLLLIACSNDPAFKQKLEKISERTARLKQGIKKELEKFDDMSNQSAEEFAKEKATIEEGNKNLVEILILFSKEELQKLAGEKKKRAKSNIKILKNILEKRIQIEEQEAARRKLAA